MRKKKIPDFSIEDIERWYHQHNDSFEDIAKRIGVSPPDVVRIFRANGIRFKLDKYTAFATLKASQYLWIINYGPIPEGYHIHHINGKENDNRIENLELLSPKEHKKAHKLLNIDWGLQVLDYYFDKGMGITAIAKIMNLPVRIISKRVEFIKKEIRKGLENQRNMLLEDD